MREFFLGYQVVFQGIVLLCGIILMSVAFGRWPMSRDPEANERWRKEKAPILKVASVIMVASTALSLALRYL